MQEVGNQDGGEAEWPLDQEEQNPGVSQPMGHEMEQVEAESVCDLSSAPDWVRKAYEDRSSITEPLDIDPAEQRAQFIRDRLLIALKRQGMTQTALAERLGKHPSQISRIFANPDKSQLRTLADIAEALGVDLSDIVRDVDPHKLAS